MTERVNYLLFKKNTNTFRYFVTCIVIRKLNQIVSSFMNLLNNHISQYNRKMCKHGKTIHFPEK